MVFSAIQQQTQYVMTPLTLSTDRISVCKLKFCRRMPIENETTRAENIILKRSTVN